MIAPETMEAAVQENNRNAAQKTPEIWSPKFTAIKTLVALYQVALNAESSVIRAVLSFIIDGANPGPVGKAFPTGPGLAPSIMNESTALITDDSAFSATWYKATSVLMAVNLGDHISGVFWAAFLLFSWTAASIVSGAIIERITTFAFGILAIAIGSVFWTIDAAWGWHFDGWMLKLLGYHDAYASGVIHAIAGGFALGVLMVLGPRIGKFSSSGEPRNIGPRNPWLVTVGLFLIYTGFWASTQHVIYQSLILDLSTVWKA